MNDPSINPGAVAQDSPSSKEKSRGSPRPNMLGNRPLFRPEAEQFRMQRHLGATIKPPATLLKYAPLLPPVLLSIGALLLTTLTYSPQIEGIFAGSSEPELILPANPTPHFIPLGSILQIRTVSQGHWQDYRVAEVKLRPCLENEGFGTESCMTINVVARGEQNRNASFEPARVTVRLPEQLFLQLGKRGGAYEENSL